MSGTRMGLCYGVCGAALAYRTTGCAVLRSRMAAHVTCRASWCTAIRELSTAHPQYRTRTLCEYRTLHSTIRYMSPGHRIGQA
eukprot:3940993-Rhodomonas_salina.4